MTNLELAQAFEDSLSFLWDGGEQYAAQETQWSCDALYSSLKPGCGRVARLPSKVEPGICGRRHAFDEFMNRPRRQQARALWVTLLAELAERGDLTVDGLK